MRLPATPAGRQVEWIIRQLIVGETDPREVEERFAPSFLARVPVEEVVAVFRRASLPQDATLEAAQERSPHAQVVIVGGGDRRLRIDAAVEPEPPHRLTAVRVRPPTPSMREILESVAPAGDAALGDVVNDHVGPLAGGLRAGGVVVGVLRDAEQETVALGDAPADALFEIGSVTKPFTGILLAELVRTGECALGDPVRRYLPEKVSVPRDGDREITLGDLATHSAGLPRSPDFAPRDHTDPYASFTVERLYEALGRTTLVAPIGARRAYSNYGFGLLGHALERAGGRSYGELLTERICAPLGLRETVVDPPPELRARRAHGHARSGERTPHWTPGAILGAGGIESTIGDMVAFVRANLDPAATSIAPSLEEAQSPRGDRDGGLGWGLVTLQDRSTIVQKNGGTGGFSSFLAFNRPTRTGVVALCNAQTDALDPAALAVLGALLRR